MVSNIRNGPDDVSECAFEGNVLLFGLLFGIVGITINSWICLLCCERQRFRRTRCNNQRQRQTPKTQKQRDPGIRVDKVGRDWRRNDL